MRIKPIVQSVTVPTPGRRKGCPRRLRATAACNAAGLPTKIEVIFKNKKLKSDNAITNYFSTKSTINGVQNRSSWLGTNDGASPVSEVIDIEDDCTPPPTSTVSPHKIQALGDSEMAPLVVYVESRRSPFSPAAGRDNRSSPLVQQKPAAKPAQLKVGGDNCQLLTDLFPVRRSCRRTKRALEEDRNKELCQRLMEQRCGADEVGLEVRLFAGKGRGVVATRQFRRGDFVVEYVGALIDMDEARRREKTYALDQNAGCYMYYFRWKGGSWCVDGTAESDRLGRLINHSRHGNLTTKTLQLNGQPRLVLQARCDIQPGQELLYDYGDRNRDSLQHHPWLAS